MDIARIFDVEQVGTTVVLNLRRGLSEIEFDEAPPDVARLLELLRKEQVANIVVDCHEIDFLRSTAVGFFVILWQRIKGRGGLLVFCNVSAKAKDVLATTKLDRIWRVCGSRVDAMAAIEK